MAVCDSEFQGMWREATNLLGQARLLLQKVRQDSFLLTDSDYDGWFKRLKEFEDDSDKKNILTLIG